MAWLRVLLRVPRFFLVYLLLYLINVDNAQLGEQRLILLDSTLVFSMAMSVWMYVLFYRYRHQPFSKPWWTWLIATGVALSCVISTKYVGLFTFVTIGSAVAIDLWNLLDYRRGLPMVFPFNETLLTSRNYSCDTLRLDSFPSL
jgi:dolichyl-phosphate-mannose--protein O-mannosyl transferase